MKFIDLFAGLGGFHIALKQLGHECVFASEIDTELNDLYYKNFGIQPSGDIRSLVVEEIPEHDILCAGFPCQPYSKAGEQLGSQCPQWGDLFHDHIIRILKFHMPEYFIMENVANLIKHNQGITWSKMEKALSKLGYKVHTKILSPHKFGIPQIRERLYIVSQLHAHSEPKWPKETNEPISIHDILDKNPRNIKPIPEKELKCLKVWQDFLDKSPKNIELPSFPIWTMEFGATYPFEEVTPYKLGGSKLKNYKGAHGVDLSDYSTELRMSKLPSYAQTKQNKFPRWKINYIKQNREFYEVNKEWIDPWLYKILEFPPSWQKFEWNCKGEQRDIWNFILQFRASGVRVKRPTTSPSLIASTTTQLPIIAWQKRYMTANECLKIQSLDSLEYLPKSQTKIIKSLGNAVNAEVVMKIAVCLLNTHSYSENESNSIMNEDTQLELAY